MKRRHYFSELAPLADKLREIRNASPRPVSVAKDVPACLDKQAAKRARRAARARQAGQL